MSECMCGFMRKAAQTMYSLYRRNISIRVSDGSRTECVCLPVFRCCSMCAWVAVKAAKAAALLSATKKTAKAMVTVSVAGVRKKFLVARLGRASTQVHAAFYVSGENGCKRQAAATAAESRSCLKRSASNVAKNLLLYNTQSLPRTRKILGRKRKNTQRLPKKKRCQRWAKCELSRIDWKRARSERWSEKTTPTHANAGNRQHFSPLCK